jgi:hypothetical protein
VAVEVLDAGRRRLDRGPQLGVDGLERAGDLGLGHPQLGHGRAVEPLGELAHRDVAALADVGQDGLHGRQRTGFRAVGPGQVRPQFAGQATEVETVQHDGPRYKAGRRRPPPVPAGAGTWGAGGPVDRGDGQQPGRSLVNSHPAR